MSRSLGHSKAVVGSTVYAEILKDAQIPGVVQLENLIGLLAPPPGPGGGLRDQEKPRSDQSRADDEMDSSW